MPDRVPDPVTDPAVERDPSPAAAAFARRVVALARLAPSVHNTQPWAWYAEDDRLELWADRSRGLGVLDPAGRQLVLSCGAALLHARLAVRGAGRACAVEAFPDPAQPDHLATLEIGGDLPPEPAERVLAGAMRRRHTARAAFSPRRVDADARDRLRRAAEAEGAVLHLVPDSDRVVLAVLLAHADQREAADPAYRAELRSWVRARAADDGVPAAAGAEAATGGRHTDLTLRDFGVEAPGAGRAEGDAADAPPPPDERPLLGVLLTDGDGRTDWLAAGQALARVLLTGAAEGIGASPLGQLVDAPAACDLLRRELRLVGHPQMVLRLGYGVGPGAPRRAVDDVLVVASHG